MACSQLNQLNELRYYYSPVHGLVQDLFTWPQLRLGDTKWNNLVVLLRSVYIKGRTIWIHHVTKIQHCHVWLTVMGGNTLILTVLSLHTMPFYKQIYCKINIKGLLAFFRILNVGCSFTWPGDYSPCVFICLLTVCESQHVGSYRIQRAGLQREFSLLTFHSGVSNMPTLQLCTEITDWHLQDRMTHMEWETVSSIIACFIFVFDLKNRLCAADIDLSGAAGGDLENICAV